MSDQACGEIEELPMEIRNSRARDPYTDMRDEKIFNGRKNSSPGNEDSGFSDEYAFQSCAARSHDKPSASTTENNIIKVTSPLPGKYGNTHYGSKNGLHGIGGNSSTKRNGFLLKSSSTGDSANGNAALATDVAMQPLGLEQQAWTNKGHYFVAVLTYLFGVGNIIWFPRLCFKHGGGAFFIPYFIMLVLEGIPLVCLEMAIGQRLGRSNLVEAWRDLSPGLSGIGVAAMMQSLITCFYYNYIIAWFLYYFIHSLRGTLPWETCPTYKKNGNVTISTECEKSGPAVHYWYRETLDVADDVTQSTGINLYLYLFVVISWFVSFLLSMRGLRRTSKILFVLLLLIITNMVTFFFVGVHLDGWAEGLARLFIPEWERLLDPAVWMDAAGQIFYSLGIGFGTLIILSSGNNAKNNCYEDALICALSNSGISMCASIVMYSFFGYKAHFKTSKCLAMAAKLINNGTSPKLAINVSCSKKDVFDQIPPGLSLGFAGLSEAFTEMSLSPLWSALFYFLLFSVGASSMLGTLEALLTTLREIGFFPRGWRYEVLCGAVCLVFCISNLLFVQSTGFYLLEIISGATSIPLLLTGLAECVGVAYVYGLDKFSKDLTAMTGKPVKNRWKICWKFISPLIILGVITGGVVQMIKDIANGKYSYTAWNRKTAKTNAIPYPPWGYIFHLAFLLVPCVCFIYPSLKNIYRSNRQDQQQEPITNQESSTVVCKSCTTCYGGRFGNYDVSLSGDPPYANGHVNLTTEVE